MGIGGVLSDFVEAYGRFHSTLSPLAQDFITLFTLVLLVVIYSVFVWKLREFISSKNIFKFNLNRYNRSSHPAFAKVLASGFYLLEYILIIPFIVFFWFAIFTFLLMMIVEESMAIHTILFISAIVVAVIRMTAYIPNYGKELSEDIAKFLPFTFLGIALLDPGIFTELLGRVASRLENLSSFFSEIINYLVFIASLEVLLRFFEFIFNITEIHEDEGVEEDEEPVNQ